MQDVEELGRKNGELHATVRGLRARVRELESDNTHLQARVEACQSQVAQLEERGSAERTRLQEALAVVREEAAGERRRGEEALRALTAEKAQLREALRGAEEAAVLAERERAAERERELMGQIDGMRAALATAEVSGGDGIVAAGGELPARCCTAQ